MTIRVIGTFCPQGTKTRLDNGFAPCARPAQVSVSCLDLTLSAFLMQGDGQPREVAIGVGDLGPDFLGAKDIRIADRQYTTVATGPGELSPSAAGEEECTVAFHMHRPGGPPPQKPQRCC